MILYGAASGQPDRSMRRPWPEGVAVRSAPTLMTYARTPELLRERAGKYSRWSPKASCTCASGALPLDQAAQAHRDLEARKNDRELVLIP